MPSYGDLFLHLKNNEKIYPKDLTFEHVENWFMSNVNHNINVPDSKCTKSSWLKDFFATFKKESKAIWLSSKGHVHMGRNDAVDFFLKKPIPIEYEECSCDAMDTSDPIDASEPMDPSESQCSYRLIALGLSIFGYCFRAIALGLSL